LTNCRKAATIERQLNFYERFMLSQFCKYCGFHSALDHEYCRQCGYKTSEIWEPEVTL